MHLPSKLLSERSSKSENLLKILPRSFGITLALGHYRGRLEGQQNEDIISFDLNPISRGTGTEVSGILGFTLLHMLTIKIDYRDGLVDFDYKRGPWD